MIQEVENSTEEDAVSDTMLVDRGKRTQNGKVSGNFGMGAISSPDLA